MNICCTAPIAITALLQPFTPITIAAHDRYRPQDDITSIRAISSAVETLGEMQRIANVMSALAKDPTSLDSSNPLSDTLESLKLKAAISAGSGSALVYFKEKGDCMEVVYCVGNLGLGNNEQAEEVLIRTLIDTAKSNGLATVTAAVRTSPSGSSYIAPFYESLGFAVSDQDEKKYILTLGAEVEQTPAPEPVVAEEPAVVEAQEEEVENDPEPEPEPEKPKSLVEILMKSRWVPKL